MMAYVALLQQHIFKLPEVSRVRSQRMLRKVKYETALPVA